MSQKSILEIHGELIYNIRAIEKRDYYQVLGITKNTSGEEIKKAYRRLVMKYHPDRNPDSHATGKMTEINEAFAVLKTAQRQVYSNILI